MRRAIDLARRDPGSWIRSAKLTSPCGAAPQLKGRQPQTQLYTVTNSSPSQIVSYPLHGGRAQAPATALPRREATPEISQGQGPCYSAVCKCVLKGRRNNSGRMASFSPALDRFPEVLRRVNSALANDPGVVRQK